jgi:hypothetical protein
VPNDQRGPFTIPSGKMLLRALGYQWPAAHAAGFLKNDGSGNLSDTPLVTADVPLITTGAGTSTASASSVTLPTDGNQIPISGTTTINTLVTTGNAGRQVTLRFVSAGCRVASSDRGSGGNIVLHGPYSSLANGTLTLFCDGTSWYELGRSKYRLPTVTLTRNSTLTLAVGYNDIPFTAETEDSYGLFAPTSTTVTITAETAGLWLIAGSAIFDTTAGGQRLLYFTINGSLYTVGSQPGSTVVQPGYSGTKLIRLANAGTVVLTAYTDVICNVGTNAAGIGPALEMHWLEP